VDYDSELLIQSAAQGKPIFGIPAHCRVRSIYIY